MSNTSRKVILQNLATERAAILESISEYKWERASNYIGPDYSQSYILYGKNRDSDYMVKANFDAIYDYIKELDKTEEYIHIESASHWACGWIEYILVDESAPIEILNRFKDIREAIEDYPIFCEGTVYEYKQDEIREYISSYSDEELESILKNYKIDIERAIKNFKCDRCEAIRSIAESIVDLNESYCGEIYLDESPREQTLDFILKELEYILN